MGGILKGITSAVTPIANAIAPVASFIPGYGQLIGAADAGLNVLNNVDGGASGSGGGSSSNPYAQLSSALGPAAAAAAAKQNADQAKNIMNQSLVQDTSSTNDAITQMQNLIAGLQGSNPLNSGAYATPASLEQPSAYSWVNPQTMSAMTPSVQGQAPTMAPQGPAPNSYMNAVGTAAGQTAPPNPVAVNATPSTPTAALGAPTTAATPGASAAQAAQSWTPQQLAAINAAVSSSLGGIQGGETVGQIGSLAQQALTKSGLFSPQQAAALGQAAQWDPHGASFREQGSNVQPFQTAELSSIMNNYQGAYGTPPAAPAAAAAPTPASAPAPVAAQPAPVAAPRMTQPVARMPARQIMGY